MSQQTPNPISLSGTQFLYGEPEVLNIDVHGALRYRADSSPYVKAEDVHLVPLLVGEFAQAMMHYPIIFAGEEKTPVAVMGLSEGQNFFVKNGQFEEGAYVPTYLRRHPFTLASTGNGKFVVCIDRAAAGFVTEGEGEALFENGEASEFTKHATAFLTEFESEAARTRAFVDALSATGMFDVTNTAFLVKGRQELAPEYFAVAEERLGALGDSQLARLVRSGAMAAIDAHRLSLQRWNVLLARRIQIGDKNVVRERRAA